MLQLILKVPEVKEGPAWLKLDDEIQIAGLIRFAADNRANEAHMGRAVLGAEAKNRIAFLFKQRGTCRSPPPYRLAKINEEYEVRMLFQVLQMVGCEEA